MDFQRFIDEMKNDLTEWFSDKIPGLRLEQQAINKLQGESYTALTATQPGKPVGVNLNMDQLYERFQQDNVMFDELVDEAAEQIEISLQNPPALNVFSMLNYDAVKNMLVVEVVSTERNAEMLEKIPHTEVDDLSLVYRVQLEKTSGGMNALQHNEGTRMWGVATVLVTNDHLKLWDVTPEQLHEDAMRSTVVMRPPLVKSMTEVMAEMMDVSPSELGMESPLYVVTNAEKLNGAAALFYPEVMAQCAEAMGSDFFVLPSSTHETLLLPDTGEFQASELAFMVGGVNDEAVDVREQLSTHAYHYDAKKGIFESADRFEERMQEKQAAKHSVLDDLKSSKEKVAAKPPKEKAAKSMSDPSL